MPSYEDNLPPDASVEGGQSKPTQQRIKVDPPNFKNMTYGDPIPDSQINGKNVVLKAFTHKIAGSSKDWRTFPTRIDAIFDMQNKLNKIPDFGMGPAVEMVRKLRDAQNPADLTGGMETGPSTGEPTSREPRPPQMYQDTQGREAIMQRIMGMQEPNERFDLRNVDPFQKALIIGSLVGNMIAKKGRGGKKILGNWMQGQQQNVDAKNVDMKSKRDIAMAIAQMQLGQINAREEYENSLRAKDYDAKVKEHGWNVSARNMADDDFTKKKLDALNKVDISGEDKAAISEELARHYMARAQAALNRGDTNAYTYFTNKANDQRASTPAYARSRSVGVEKVDGQISNWKSLDEDRKSKVKIAQQKADSADANYKSLDTYRKTLGEAASRRIEEQVKQWAAANGFKAQELDLARGIFGLNKSKFEFDKYYKIKGMEDKYNSTMRKAAIEGAGVTIKALERDLQDNQKALADAIDETNPNAYLSAEEMLEVNRMLKTAADKGVDFFTMFRNSELGQKAQRAQSALVAKLKGNIQDLEVRLGRARETESNLRRAEVGEFAPASVGVLPPATAASGAAAGGLSGYIAPNNGRGKK